MQTRNAKLQFTLPSVIRERKLSDTTQWGAAQQLGDFSHQNYRFSLPNLARDVRRILALEFSRSRQTCTFYFSHLFATYREKISVFLVFSLDQVTHSLELVSLVLFLVEISVLFASHLRRKCIFRRVRTKSFWWSWCCNFTMSSDSLRYVQSPFIKYSESIRSHVAWRHISSYGPSVRCCSSWCQIKRNLIFGEWHAMECMEVSSQHRHFTAG